MAIHSMDIDDAYEILGLNSNARLPELKRARRKQNRLIIDNKAIDPGLKTIRRDALAKIGHAYELLVNNLKRREYYEKAQFREENEATGEEEPLAVEMDPVNDAKPAESTSQTQSARKHSAERNSVAKYRHNGFQTSETTTEIVEEIPSEDGFATYSMANHAGNKNSKVKYRDSISHSEDICDNPFSGYSRSAQCSSEDDSLKKMHHSMGSNYGESGDEENYRRPLTRTRSRSRTRSRHRSHSRNRAHIDAYTPRGSKNFVEIGHIVQDRSQCVDCHEEFRPDAILRLDCQHSWCRPCLSMYIGQSHSAGYRWPPECCRPEIIQRASTYNFGEPLEAEYVYPVTSSSSMIKCPNCSKTFCTPLLLINHHEANHLEVKSSPEEIEILAKPTSSDTRDDESITPSSISSQITRKSSETTSVTYSDLDEHVSSTSAPVPRSSPAPAPKRASEHKRIQSKFRFYRLLEFSILLIGKCSVHFLGLQTTAWFVLVLAAVATAITTTYSLQGPPQDPPPQIGDSNYYSLLSQSIIAICSLYYLMVPYLRGDEDLPVRALFYVCWTLSLASAITAPLIYAQEWTKSVWASFGSTLAQVAATAFLFEHIGSAKAGRTIEGKRSHSRPPKVEATKESIKKRRMRLRAKKEESRRQAYEMHWTSDETEYWSTIENDGE